MTKLNTSDLLSVAQDLGLEIEEKKSYYMISNPEFNNKAIYVAMTKRSVTRVDLAGFAFEGESITTHTPEEAKTAGLGAVHAQILTKQLSEEVSDDVILSDFERACQELLNPEKGWKLAKRGSKKAEREAARRAKEAQNATSEDDSSVDSSDDSDDVTEAGQEYAVADQA